MSPGSALLHTERFALCLPDRADLPELFDLTRDDETRRFLGGFEPSLTDSFARLLRNGGSWSLWGYGTFAVRAKNERRIIATCGVFRSFRGFGPAAGLDDAAEAGWIVHRDWWGRGVASEAMTAALAWFDQTHGRQRIAAMIEQGHAASEAVASKLGFIRYGQYCATDGPVLGLWERAPAEGTSI